MNDVSRLFLDDSRAFLTKDYLPQIERCVAQLTEEQVWSREGGASNSIGNLMLHLAGSSRQWALETIAGKPTGRDRQSEFDRRDPISIERLRAELRAAVEEVDRVLAALPGESLLTIRTRHGEELTVLWCVYHIVEHFSMHTGQINSMTKALVGELTHLT
jgi:uncharacterized damage-inducible protein DinB